MKKSQFHRLLLLSIVSILFIWMTGCSNASDSKAGKVVKEKTELLLATTTSTQDSGLLDVLIPLFEKEAGFHVKTIAVGTGQALELGTKGEADVLLVHAPSAEEELVETEDVINRKRVMYNDFIVVGPSSDPASVKGKTVTEAFQTLAASNHVFISRGDDSGTHKKELEIWEAAGGKPTEQSSYLETGQGMGATLQIAAEKESYVLTDRATYLAQQKNLTNLTISNEGDSELLNIYHVMQVNPEKHEKVNADGAKAFVNFMINESTQSVITNFGKDEFGQSLFHSYTE